jgi:hypothetical protein
MPALNSERAKSHANLDDLTSKLQQMHGKQNFGMLESQWTAQVLKNQ